MFQKSWQIRKIIYFPLSFALQCLDLILINYELIFNYSQIKTQ